MVFTPDYTIEVDGKKIPLLFNSLFYREFCAAKGIELEDLFDLIKQGKAFKGGDLPLLLHQAALTWHRYNAGATAFPFNHPEDSCLWLDVLGGYNSLKLMDVYKIFVCKLSNIDPNEFEVMLKAATEQPEVEEKKKEAVNASHGEVLNA